MATIRDGPLVREKGFCKCSDQAIGSCFHHECVIRKWIMGRAMLMNSKGYIALFDVDQFQADIG